MSKEKKRDFKVLAENRQARHDFDFISSHEAGMVLEGWQVKAIRAGRLQIAGTYAKVINNELFLVGAQLTPLANSGVHVGFTNNLVRANPKAKLASLNNQYSIKLCLKRKTINEIGNGIHQTGLSVIVDSVYSDDRGFIKARVSFVRGRKKHDKRQALKEKDIQRRGERHDS